MAAECAQFTCDAATYADLQLELSQIWAKTRTKKALEYPGMLAGCILENQGMRPVREITENGTCVAWKAAWLQNCDDDEANKGTSFSQKDCDIPVGTGLDCAEVEYSVNCYIDTTVNFTDADCTSMFRGVDQAAIQLDKAFEKIRKAISTSLMGQVVANAAVNNYTDTYGNINGTRTEFTSAEFVPNLLYHMQYTAIQNHCNIDDMVMLDGSNFWETYQGILDGRCCGDEGEMNAFNRYNMKFDPWLDKSLGRRSTFLFDPSAFGIINVTRFDNTIPERLQGDGDGEKVIYGWKVQDPMFNIRQYSAENGSETVRPIEYDVEYTKKCCGRDARGNRIYSHTFFVTYTGVEAMNPVGCNDGQCVLEFTNIG